MSGDLDALLTAVRSRSTGIGSPIHGELHWRTVGANGLWLAEADTRVDRAVVFHFALLHDTMRENDGYDPEHGPRASAFAAELHAEGLLALDDAQLALLREACDDHADGLTSPDPTIGACWDADRLDLPRVGITPDPDLLSTAAALSSSLRAGPPPEWDELHARYAL